MQLTPREYFTIARGLEDHTDNTVFYVQAKIRNARTDALIDTINLTNQGDNHRYSYPWQVPADVSGNGFYILVTTSVYTDSGYTTKSTLYGDKYDTYLVMERVNPMLNGGGGVDIDYKKIQKMIDEAIKTIPKEEKVVIPAPDFTSINKSISDVLKRIDSIKIPEQANVDLSSIENSLSSIEKAISSDELQNEEETKINSAISNLESSISSKTESMDKIIDDMNNVLENIRSFFSDDVEEIKDSLEWIKKTVERIDVIYMTDRLDKIKEK